MSFRCHNCQSEIKSDVALLDRPSRCENCGSTIDTNFLGHVKRNVGIHPALARRYVEIEKSYISDHSTVYQATKASPTQTKATNHARQFHYEAELDEIVPRIPGYELLDCIGKGAMGSVYKARHLSSGRDAAVKILSPELSNRRDLVARFEREAAALRAFRHPNVVAIFDSGSYGHTHYYGMEFIEGINLRRYIKKGPIEIDKAIYYMRSILRGLKAAHDRGIIHRDLKPENILVEKVEGHAEERVVLVDFGLAGILNESNDPHPNLTRSKVTMGTVNYMAPEQHDDAKRVDFRSDLYACGVILYECITGDLPLGRFLFPTERGLRVPALVDSCLAKALARPVKERYQSVSEFDADLLQIQEQLKTFLPAKFLLPKTDMPTSIPLSAISNSPEEYSSLGNDSIYKTIFASVPLWVKKPKLVYGILALLVGLVIGIMVAQQTPKEVIISSAGARPVYARVSFNAPAPQFISTSSQFSLADFLTLSSRNDKDYVKYKSLSSIWGFSNSQIIYQAKQGDSGHFRRDLSFVVTPVEVPLTSATVQGKISFKTVTLPVTLTKTQQLARELLGGNPETAAGGVFYVNQSVDRAVGMMFFVDGTCGVAELQKQNDLMQLVQYEKGSCRVSPMRSGVEIALNCDMLSGKCRGLAENYEVANIHVENISKEKWQIALGCRNINCMFKVGSNK